MDFPLRSYFDAARQALDNHSRVAELRQGEGRRLLIAGSAWGKYYVDMLIDYCLPSLMASVDALIAERQLIISLHTDSIARVENSAPVKRLMEKGVEFIFHPIDANTSIEKYAHLGLLQSVDLYLAKLLFADYHLLMPDHVYSEKHFEGLMRLVKEGKEAITRVCISTQWETIRQPLERYRQEDRTLTIPAADLIAIGLANLHPRSQGWMVRDGDTVNNMPSLHIAGLVTKDKLHIFGPHQSILYLTRQITFRLQPVIYNPIDGDMHKVIPRGVLIYKTRAEDEICLIEVATAEIPGGQFYKVDMERFCQIYWLSIPEAPWSYNDMEMIDPINRELLLNQPYITEEAAIAARNHIITSLRNSYVRR